jgi:signal transduction histidine kinase
MKQNRTYIYIAISSIALLILLIIQVNWIVKTANIKEEIFNEKANIILSRTTEALRNDKETCRKIGACADNNKSNGSNTKLGKEEGKKIDSLFNYYMKLYNFHIEYSYTVTKSGNNASTNENGFTNYSYYKPLNDTDNDNGIEIKLIFPEKKQYIIAEMGVPFITSVLLIMVVMILFWRTQQSLIKEKKISEHTTDFLNNMTHEIKTPLTNIALAGKAILKDSSVKESDKIKHYSSIILEENEKLRLQVEQVLSMTAFERGEIPLMKTKLDLHELINESIKCMNMQIESKNGIAILNLNAQNSLLMGDKTYLTNAICNLIDNSIKYSNEKPEIAIHSFNRGHNIILTISDKGIGIEKEYHKKVFEKFFRVPTGDVHDVKGFGLGLACIKKIVELHGGTIELESEKGKGTTFTITLPNV